MHFGSSQCIAYGMEIADQSFSNTAVPNKFLYNGKEYDSNTGYYQYGFRQYDAQIGRWHVIDALSERYYSTSPYMYVMGNPVNYYDVLGLYTAFDAIRDLWRSENGGTWNAGDASPTYFSSGSEAAEWASANGLGKEVVFKWKKESSLYQNLRAYFRGYGNRVAPGYYWVSFNYIPDPPTVIGIYAHEAFFEYIRKKAGWFASFTFRTGIRDDVEFLAENMTGSIWELKKYNYYSDFNINKWTKSLYQLGKYIDQARIDRREYRWSFGTSNGNPKPFEEEILKLPYGQYKFYYSIPEPKSGLIFYDYELIDPKLDLQPENKTEPKPNFPWLVPIGVPVNLLENSLQMLLGPMIIFPFFYENVKTDVKDYQMGA